MLWSEIYACMHGSGGGERQMWIIPTSDLTYDSEFLQTDIEQKSCIVVPYASINKQFNIWGYKFFEFVWFTTVFVTLLYLQDKVRSQDSVFVIAGVTGSVKGRELAWKFVQEKWAELHKRYEGGFLLSRLIKVWYYTLTMLDVLMILANSLDPDEMSQTVCHRDHFKMNNQNFSISENFKRTIYFVD